jgi:2-polyprenyl-3-methyl-5-hydroxy-6-metoxy-1,4-benzoquinol methylase
VWIRHSLVACLCRVPGLQEKLEAGCKVADVGCGGGEAVMTAAAAFPASTFHGYDISEDALRWVEGGGRRGADGKGWEEGRPEPGPGLASQ